ncbi:NAD(P)-binding protein [Calothrix membranacea FACHB-236]|nr:NAD(P)-binding protein [Calothrix membranacea FACHB-236]
MFCSNIGKPDQESHALVIGGSIAGLLAAQVLSKYFHRVTIIERDRLSEQPEQRSGCSLKLFTYTSYSNGVWMS